jgi:hypothetical protein
MKTAPIYLVTAQHKPTGKRVNIHSNLSSEEARCFIIHNCKEKCWTEKYKLFRKKLQK